MSNIRAQLKDHLENGKDWEKMETPIQGVYIVKVPKTKTHDAMLFLEINPLDDYGKPQKKKGLFIKTRETLVRYAEALNEDLAYKLIHLIDQVNTLDEDQLEYDDDTTEENIEEYWNETADEQYADTEEEKVEEIDRKLEKDEEEIEINSISKSNNNEKQYAFSDYIYEDRIYIQKMSINNRDSLFVEVNQKDLMTNIFNPIHNLFKYESHFFPKRFAILGAFKTGKTELGKYIIHKMKKYYKECIALTINSKQAQYKNVDEIDDWLYDQWYVHLLQVSDPEFKEIVVKKVKEFKDIRGSPPTKSLDKIYMICQIYKDYLSIKPKTKFIVEFDQANVLEIESQFTPFFEFWRNFQGFWENDEYFSELPIFIFVIGHKSWTNFAALKDPIGRGVFDLWVNYDYWNNADLEEMFRKRLLFSIKPKYQEKLINYFLCSGIIDYFGKRFGKASTQIYLDNFFGNYFKKFLDDFVNNLEEYNNFLIYCKEQSKKDLYDEKYFTEVENVFTSNPALDYMPVFKFLSNNQNEKWFIELFSLMSYIYENNYVSFESKDFRKYKNLDYKFIDDNFTQSPLSGIKPIFFPPIFANYDKKLTFNDAFKSSLETLEGISRGSPISLLQKFVQSKRIGREVFVATEHDKKMENLLKNINQKSLKIFDGIQKWVVNKFIEETYLTPFYKVKDDTYQFYQLYEKNLTNWAIFDNMGREIANHLIEGTFPRNSLIASEINFEGLNEIRSKVISETTSSLQMAQYVNDILTGFLTELEKFDTKLVENESYFTKNGKLKIIEENILVVIDGPNSLGKDYKDQLDLEQVAIYAHNINKNAELHYLTKTNENHIKQEYISRLGYLVQVSHKDIDYAVKDLIRKKLKSIEPPNLILLGVKDQDYMDFIKQIRKEFKIKVKLIISSEEGLPNSLKRAFEGEDILYFSKQNQELNINKNEHIYEFFEGKLGDPISRSNIGKICLPDIEGKYQPKAGEKWICKIKDDKEKCIILTLIKKK